MGRRSTESAGFRTGSWLLVAHVVNHWDVLARDAGVGAEVARDPQPAIVASSRIGGHRWDAPDSIPMQLLRGQGVDKHVADRRPADRAVH
jgi:hypothetical protein